MIRRALRFLAGEFLFLLAASGELHSDQGLWRTRNAK
jgi:hypothetical protein